MIHIKEEYFAIIKAILAKYPYSFYAFGSRVRGTHQEFSDLDICYMETIPLLILAQLKDEFEQSNLPFKVDLVSFNEANQNFKAIIQADLILIQQKTT
jgi:predicted nucleotidyltransferase